MNNSIDNQILNKHGIVNSVVENENGELRFAQESSDDNSKYIKTITPHIGGWQNSHYHKSCYETYIVQKGWIVMAKFLNYKRILSMYSENEIVTIEPNVIHNLYLSSDTIIHTIKHGTNIVENDWHESLAFDSVTKPLEESEIINILKNQKL